ncbi:MAG TPA: hypothetical protein VGK13_04665 [Methanocellaceae archaeon]|jgi:hypothetical protein
MRVKLLIALALASVFLLAGALQAGAVQGTVVEPSFTSVVFQAPFSPLTAQAVSIPSVVEICPPVGNVNTITANNIQLTPPNLAAAFALGTPGAPAFVAPDFVGAQVECPPFAVPEFSVPTFFDP